MRILMLTPYLPWPLVSGGQIRTYNLLKNLSRQHQITLFALIKHKSDKQYIKNLKPFCTDIQVFRRSTKPFTIKNILRAGLSLYPFVVTRNLVPDTKDAVTRALHESNYDLIHAETFYMMPNIPQTDVPTILVEQTIEYLGYQSYAGSNKKAWLKPLLYLDIAKIKYWERYYWQRSDRLITMSQEDKDFILKELPKIENIDVVANGVDIPYFDTVPKTKPAKPTILFVGTFSWLPNVQAVKHLVYDIWPLITKKLPGVRLHIVGFSPTTEIVRFGKLDHITVSGSVEDIRTAYATSHVLLAPVKWGKGTRYKILEAMATHTPVVATPLAVEGITGIKPGTHALIGSSPKKLADLTVKLLSEPSLQKKLAQNSYALVRKRYNWPRIADQLSTIYETIGSRP
jgi:polysaccharide biosynthesis protein PslH